MTIACPTLFRPPLFRPLRLAALLLAGVSLAACSEDEPPKLQGERIPIRAVHAEEAARLVERAPLPDATETGIWTHAGGDAQHSGGRRDGPGAGATVAWTADAGRGPGEFTAPATPVVADGRIFVRDGASGVRAFDASTGRAIWTVDLTPEGEDEDTGFGGGLAIGAGGTLYATTGFGEVVSVDPADGSVRWRRRGMTPYRSAPVAFEGVVTAVDRGNSVVGLDAATGAVLWQAEGQSTRQGGIGRGAPAAVPGAAIVPFGSGDLAILRNRSGVRIWSRNLAGVSTGAEGLSAFPDITSGPSLMGGIVIASTAGGPLAAVDGRSGRQIWSREFGALSPAWPAGTTLFVVTTEPRVMRLDGPTGTTMWSQPLPFYEDPDDREGPITWTGPVLAGNLLWVSSSAGELRAFDGVSGEPAATVELPDGASSSPIAVNGTIYVLTDEGRLVAVR